MKRFLSLLSFLSLFVAWSYADITLQELFTVNTAQTYGTGEVPATAYRDIVQYDGKLYVLTNAISESQRIMVLDAVDGSYIKDLNTTGISGGAIAMGNISITDDGKLVAMNCQSNCSTGDVKAYYWADDDAAPVNFITTRLAQALRVDCGTYVGTLESGALWTVYSAGSKGSTASAIKMNITDGSLSSVNEYILVNYAGNTSSRITKVDGNILFMTTKGATYGWQLNDDYSTTIKYYINHTTNKYTNALKFFEYDGTKYYASIDYRNTTNTITEAYITLYSYTSLGRWSATGQTLVASFPTSGGLGTGRNTSFYNGLDVRVYDGGFSIWMTCLQQGIMGCYYNKKPIFSATAESISLDQATIYLPIGGTATLTPTILPVEASGNTITWTTGNSSIATVSEGVVTAVAIGSTTITAEVDGETATCTVNVCAPVAHILPYELRRTDNGNGTYTFTFKSNTSATSGKIIFYQNGVKKGEVAIASSITAGANEVIIAKSALPQIEGVMTWSVELTGAESRVVGKLSDSADKYRYYHVRGISANVYPNTEGFGNIYITMPKDGGSDGSCTRTKEQTRGIFQLDAALNLKNPTNAGYTCGLSWPNTYYAPFRAAVGEDGLLYVSGNDESDSYKGVWVLDNPDASSGTFHSIISGTAEQGLCVTGTGSQKKLYTFEGSGTNGNIMEYAIGNNVPYTGAGTVISSAADAKMIFGRTTSATNVAADGNGGLWLYEYREAENSTYVCLSHLNSSRELDYNSNSAALGLTNSLRGGFAVNAKKNLIACGTKAKVTIFSVSWNGSGVPVLTKLYEIPISGNYIDGITFDYADNLYVITSSTEYLYVYALPTANNTTEVPAMSSLTVEAFDHIDVSSVTINEGAQSIERGNTFTFSATVLPADASDPSLTWASDNTSVATVNETTGEVTAVEVGTAHITATADGVTSAAVTVTVFKLDYDVTWEPNGATTTSVAPPASNNDLWTQFMKDYKAYYGLSRESQTIDNVRAFLNNTHCIDFITNPASPWCWLGEIIIPAAEAAGRTLDSEMKCSFDIYAFFNQLPEKSGTYGYGDYTTAGQIENWLPLWKEANNYLPPTMRATDEMPVIRKGNDLLAGWYDNSSFTGAPVTSVTADMTLYAKWIAPIELDEASADNITKIEANDGELANVILRRTFEATGYWYTLVLPFDVSAEQMEETFGAGYEVTVLESSYRKSETVIYLKFVPRTYIKAGEPCLFKPGRDIDEAIFRGVTIDNTTPVVNTTIVNMVGLYAPTDVTLSDNNYYLGSTNYLHEYVAMYQNTKGFRAYFHFNEAMAAGCSARVVFREDTATELEDLPEVNTSAVQKVIRDGQLIIIREGKEYTTQGQLIQ